MERTKELDRDAVIVGLERLVQEVLAQCPHFRLIGYWMGDYDGLEILPVFEMPGKQPQQGQNAA